MNFIEYRQHVKQLSLGKQLPDAIYLHISCFSALPLSLQTLIKDSIVALSLQSFEYQVLKFFKRDFKLSLLAYPDFLDQPFPVLQRSCTLDLSKKSFRLTSFEASKNPPILHRKETMLLPDHVDIEQFKQLTLSCEQAGFFENTQRIGFQKNWLNLIKRKGYQLDADQLIPLQTCPNTDVITHDTEVDIQRHKTAIHRYALSKPMQTLSQHDYLNGQYSLFDYGCGQGDDVRELTAHGLSITGFDPVHQPDVKKQQADIVNLGFVINVIEKPAERATCLQEAFALSQRLLVVAAMLGNAQMIAKFKRFGDGVLTQRNTFQKYYAQAELKAYIEQVLTCNAIAVAPGIFYVFKDGLDEQVFFSQRFRVRREWQQLTEAHKPVVLKRSQNKFEKHRDLYAYLWDILLNLGRIPVNNELEQAEAIRQTWGSLRKAVDSVLGFYGKSLFQQAKQARMDDLLVYFALEKFSGRQPYTHLPDSLKRDVKAFFGDYKSAQQQATDLLFAVGNSQHIATACQQAETWGYLEAQQSLTIHSTQLGQLPAVLRVYVGCATQLYGDIEAADLIKIHIHSGKVSLMLYDDFKQQALPELQERIKIKLRSQSIDFFDYAANQQRQPLYLKSRYMVDDFPHYAKQVKFDKQLLDTGLFDLSAYGPNAADFYALLANEGYQVNKFKLLKLT